MTSYCRSIVTMALSHVFSEILNVDRVIDRDPVRVNQCNWKWYHLIDWVWFPINVL